MTTTIDSWYMEDIHADSLTLLYFSLFNLLLDINNTTKNYISLDNFFIDRIVENYYENNIRNVPFINYSFKI